MTGGREGGFDEPGIPVDPRQVASLLTDEYCQRILITCFRRTASALDLARLHDIPVAACYRRVNSLVAAGLLCCVRRVLTQQGKRVSIYQARLREATLSFKDGRMHFSCRVIESPGSGMDVERDYDLDLTDGET